MTAYDDLASAHDMRDDCAAVTRVLPVPTAPSLRYEDHPHDLPKAVISVSAAAQRLANALHLHLD